MEPDDVVEEGASDGGSRVGVPKRNKMRVLGEAVNDGEDDGFPANLGQPLDEIHGDVGPDLVRHLQRLEQPSRPECLRLVALARRASAHPVLD